MHKLLSTVIDLEWFQIFIELPFVGLLIEYDWVGKYVVQADILKVFTASMSLQRLKVGIAVD